MKKLFLSALAFIGLIFTGCDFVDDSDLLSNLGVLTTLEDGSIRVSGIFLNQTIEFTNDNIYRLSKRVIFGEGSTLNIGAGTIIKAETGTGVDASSLIIARNATINANGTASQPIIMTSASDDIALGETTSSIAFNSNSRGLWGGLVILGNAPISAGGNAVAGFNGSEAQIEGVSSDVIEGRYGGSDNSDSSGSLSYVSIRFAGTDIASDNELNGLTLGGVGDGTTINNIEIYAGFDDGIEFFGGSVDVTNIIVNGQGDDAVDGDQGYSGIVSNVVVISNDSNSGFEFDGPEADLLTDSFYTIRNATLMGPSKARIAELKSGARVVIDNVLAKGYTDEEIQINGGIASMNFNDGDTMLTNWEIVDTRMVSNIVTTDQIGLTSSLDFLNVISSESSATVSGADTSVFSWTLSSERGDI